MEFVPLPLRAGLLVDLSDTEFPCHVSGWSDGPLALAGEATHYGVVAEGEAMLVDEGDTFRLRAGMFFVLPAPAAIVGAGSRGLVISRLGYRGLRMIGGPLEAEGRLRYIDGCSDTVLAAPPKRGDPCLNHLHIPARVLQSTHSHPSERIGVILRGRGECRTPEGAWALEPGMGWRIPAGCPHAFATGAGSLDVVAWHPDSDFGPTDENHPMINRTILADRE
jgi:quercetin dioxygenase-like cupin family protein